MSLDASYNPANRLVWFEEKTARVSATEGRLFAALVGHGVVRRADAHAAMYLGTPDAERPGDKMLDVLLGRLRKKIAPLGLGIHTHWMRGLELIAVP